MKLDGLNGMNGNGMKVKIEGLNGMNGMTVDNLKNEGLKGLNEWRWRPSVVKMSVAPLI